ncbi:Amidohydrolase [Rhodococcus erythropolis]|uniref:amidohydrolase family protein n=1 Tax=Rhodococcus erythropolis TaxID=1833 RepID=UPI000BB36162|nr:amidohydrolase family protein [Rhodococcus erythropolis]PBI86843.1 Amidohydrolase [Rhodococcus erythropolis]
MIRQVVDVHAHAMPMGLLQFLSDEGVADLSALDDGVVRITSPVSGVAEGAPIPLARAQFDVTQRLTDMDAMGISQQLVSLPPFVTCADADDEGLALRIAKEGNIALAAMTSLAPTRLATLGLVPLGTARAVDVAMHCLDELGCAGIAIGSRGLGREADDAVHEELWAFLSARQAPVFLHPNSVPGGARLHDYWLPQLAGFPMDTAVAVSRLVLGGVLERHPMRIALAHGGGCVPSLTGRLDLGWSRKSVARTTPHPPSHYLRRLYYDSATFSPALLRGLVTDLGADHLVVGTDYPFELADLDPVGGITAADLAPEDTAAVLAGTVKDWMGNGLPEGW